MVPPEAVQEHQRGPGTGAFVVERALADFQPSGCDSIFHRANASAADSNTGGAARKLRRVVDRGTVGSGSSRSKPAVAHRYRSDLIAVWLIALRIASSTAEYRPSVRSNSSGSFSWNSGLH